MSIKKYWAALKQDEKYLKDKERDAKDLERLRFKVLLKEEIESAQTRYRIKEAEFEAQKEVIMENKFLKESLAREEKILDEIIKVQQVKKVV